MLHTCNAARQWQGHAHEHGSKEHRAWGMAAWGMAGAVQRMAGQSRAEHLDCRGKKDCVARASARRVAPMAKTFLLRARGQTYEILVSDALTHRASVSAWMPSKV